MTTRGWCLVAAGLAAAACAVLLNERDLLRISLFAVALPLLVYLVVARSRIQVHVARELRASQVAMGEQVEVTLLVRNIGRLVIPSLLLTEQLPASYGVNAQFAISRLSRKQPVRLRYAIQPKQRGIDHLGPLQVTMTDPFGLVEVDRKLADSREIVVTPWITPLTDTLSSRSPADGMRPSQWGSADDDILVRPYRHGDELRKVHWRSTARHEEIMVRGIEHQTSTETVVLLDCRTSAHHGTGPTASFEWAISLAGSICLHLQEQGQQTELITESSKSIVPQAIGGFGSTHAMLDGLARLLPSDQDVHWHTDPAAGHDLIAILGAVSAESITQLIQCRERTPHSFAILLDVASWAPDFLPTQTRQSAELLRAAGWSVTIAQADTSPAQVWQDLGRASRTARQLGAG